MDYCPFSGEYFNRNWGRLSYGEKKISFDRLIQIFQKYGLFQIIELLINLLLRIQAKTLAENYGAGSATGEKFPLLAELFNAADLKNPRPVPPDNGAIEKKQRLYVLYDLRAESESSLTAICT
jgi:hypothetical protein